MVVRVTVPPEIPITKSSTPIGGSLIGLIFIVTVTVFPSAVPSFAF